MPVLREELQEVRVEGRRGRWPTEKWGYLVVRCEPALPSSATGPIEALYYPAETC